ncbi:MAG: hypothetical protein ABFD92_14990 [Planctomycetaceae bacterium]|nr:hypothetical protein [Planctomycetaceae bacterium]
MPSNSQTSARRPHGKWRLTKIVALSLLAVIVLGAAALLAFAPGLIRKYSNGMGVEQRYGAGLVRDVIWEAPKPASGQVNAEGVNVEPGVSARGEVMIFVRKSEDNQGDLYASYWRDDRWSTPEPVAELNSQYCEGGPELSRNGKMLYFYSDRPGGYGGYDVWASFLQNGRWSKPFNLGKEVNSEFDEIDPALNHDGSKLYFSSNRPHEAVTPEQRRDLWVKALKDRANSDHDIFCADAVGAPKGENPFADVNYREKIITALGGSPETEKAVKDALDWLTRNQEPAGNWSAAKHGGGCSDDAVTAFATLCYMGWGAKHNEDGPYRAPLEKAIKWMLANQPANGDWTRGTGSGNGMYCHGVVTTALAEASTVSKDPAVFEALKKAVAVILKAQSPSGGWRYTSAPADSDTSVVGWQVMALKSAEMAGVAIPETVFAGARRWLDTAGGGPHKGLYGYASPGPQGALVPEGMFCQQLLGLAGTDPRAGESANFVMTQLAPGPNDYATYYGTLAAFQHGGDLWEKWNPAMKTYVLGDQVKTGPQAGSWEPSGKTYGANGGRVYTTAMYTLCLEVYYRLLPMYNIKGAAGPPVAKTTTKTVQERIEPTPDTAPKAPPELTAEWVEALSSKGSNDLGLSLTREGDLAYFSSNRSGGLGGYDIYRARIINGQFQKVVNVGSPINTRANERDPSLHSHGFAMALVSDRGPDIRGLGVYESISRDVEATTDLSWLWTALQKSWMWLLLAILALAALIWMLWMLFGPKRDKMGLLAKCILASLAAHLLLLLIMGVYNMSVTLAEEAGLDAMEVAVDADALASEKLSTNLRENVTDIKNPDAESNVNMQTLPTPVDNPMAMQPVSPAEAALQVNQANIDVRIPVQDQAQRESLKSSQVVQNVIAKVELGSEQIKIEEAPATPAAAAKETAVPRADASAVANQAATHESAFSDKPLAAAPAAAAAQASSAAQAMESAAVPATAIGAPGEQKLAAAQAKPSDISTQAPALGGDSGDPLETPQVKGPVGGDKAPAVSDEAIGSGAPVTRGGVAAAAPQGGGAKAAPVAAGGATEQTVASGGGIASTIGSRGAEPLGPAQPIGKTAIGGVPVDVGGAGSVMESGPQRRASAQPEAQPGLGGVGSVSGRVEGPKAGEMGSGGPLGRPDVTARAGMAGSLKPSDAASGGVGQQANVPQLARLEGAGEAVARAIPKYMIGGGPRLEERSRNIAPTMLRDPKLRAGMLKGLGGSDKTEAAVARALNWFTAHQEPEGNWSVKKHGGQSSDDAGTAFATLCYLGWGAKHTEPGRHQKPLAKAIAWMIKNQPENGDWTRGTAHGNGMYTHGVVTVALAEAYGLTKDPALREPLRKAIAVILKAQHKATGGWRYTSTPSDSDTSVVGWQVMALKSARLAGLEIEEEPFELARGWLERVGGGTHGGLYGYSGKGASSPAMVAEGMFCQQLMGLPPTLPRMEESAKYLGENLPSKGPRNFYYWYYACLAMYQHKGEGWDTWNDDIQKVLLSSQIMQGDPAGSWDPNDAYGSYCGRVITTAMATLSLEVYYRYLPMYVDMAKPKDAPAKP